MWHIIKERKMLKDFKKKILSTMCKNMVKGALTVGILGASVNPGFAMNQNKSQYYPNNYQQNMSQTNMSQTYQQPGNMNATYNLTAVPPPPPPPPSSSFAAPNFGQPQFLQQPQQPGNIPGNMNTTYNTGAVPPPPPPPPVFAGARVQLQEQNGMYYLPPVNLFDRDNSALNILAENKVIFDAIITMCNIEAVQNNSNADGLSHLPTYLKAKQYALNTFQKNMTDAINSLNHRIFFNSEVSRSLMDCFQQYLQNSQNNISLLNNKINELENENNNLLKSKNTLEKDYENLGKEMESSKNKWEEKKKELENKNEDLQTKNSQLEQRLNDELITQEELEKNYLQKQLKNEKQISELTEKFNQATEEIQRKDKGLQGLQRNLNEINTQLQQKSHLYDMEAERATKLEDQNNVLQNQLESEKAELDETKKELERVQQELNSLKQSHSAPSSKSSETPPPPPPSSSDYLTPGNPDSSSTT